MATKVLILVRHGQYHPAKDKEPERLTTLGRRQAKLAGKRLREEKIDRIVHSTMPRAMETATLIKGELKYRRKMESTPLLRECVPGFPKALRAKAKYTDTKKLTASKLQLEKAYKKYFKLGRKDSVEVLVCHGNVIRFLICKALGIDTDSWRKLDILQGSISVVKLRSKGTLRVQVVSHNDVGHIPKPHRTFL
jgi:serine/threonine-protein phosphatase PGAM5